MADGIVGKPGGAGNDNVEGRCKGPQAEQQDHPEGSGTEPGIAAPAPAQRHQPGTWECMVQARRWLVWREVANPDPAKKPRKVPHYIDGALRGGTLDTPSDWAKLGSYVEACNRVVASNGYYEGIAFALGPDEQGGYWQGVDLDDIPENGIADLANTLPGHVEMSPSGNGAHAFGYGRHFVTLGSNDSGIEAYAGGRFFTVTENPIRYAPIGCLAQFVEQVLAPRHRAHRSQQSGDVEIIQLPPQTVTELRSALFSMRADEYDLWQRMGQALRELGDVGRGLWMEWSATSEKFNSAEAARKWHQLGGERTGYQAVFAEAQRRGWPNPNSNAARSTETFHTAVSGDFHFQFARSGDSVVQIEYLIEPWIPCRTVIGCYGRGEAGKSSWAAHAAAIVSTTRSTLWISSEEPESHIRVRHNGCGGEDRTLAVKVGNPQRIDPVTQKPVATSFNIYEHLEPAIEAFRRNPEARPDRPLGLVVLDAVVALVTWGKGESPNDDAGVKRLIAHLLDVCQRQDVSILMLGHLNKSRPEHLADAVTGSAAWTNSTRLSYMFVKDPTADFQGFVRTVKSNTGRPFGALYRTVPVYTLRRRADGHDDVVCGVQMEETLYGEIALREAIAEDDDQFLQGLAKKQAKVDAIVQAVMRKLETGPTTRREVEAHMFPAKKPSRRHWQEADRVLGITHGVQVSNGAHNTITYSLPDAN